MPEKNEEKNVKAYFVGTILTFLFSNLMLLVYGIFKTKEKNRK